MGGWLKLQNLLFFNQFYYLPAPQAEKKIIVCFMKLLCFLFCRFVVVFAVPEPVVVLWLCLWLWLCFVFVAKLVAVLVFVSLWLCLVLVHVAVAVPIGIWYQNMMKTYSGLPVLV